MPHAGDGVAEGVQAAQRVHGGRGGGGKDDAAGADGGGDGAGVDDAHADRARALIAGAGGYGRAGGEAGGAGAGVVDAGADLGAFKEARQPGHRDAGGVGDFCRTSGGGRRRAAGCRRPPACRWRTRRSGCSGRSPWGRGRGRFGRRSPAGASRTQSSLVRVKLGSAGLQVSSMRRSRPMVGFEPVALGLGALIAPDERGAEDFAVGVEHDAAMHLAGEADGFDLGGWPVRLRP